MAKRPPSKKPARLSGSAELEDNAPRKLIEFDPATLQALQLLARDSMKEFQELADEAFRDLLKKHGRPTSLKEALRQSTRSIPANDPNGACTTIHYKSATRAYIESLGYDIVASFGDQYSDLTGGFADRTFKMPNPNYYLP